MLSRLVLVLFCVKLLEHSLFLLANLISWFHQPQDSDKFATPKMPELMNCLCVEPPAAPQKDTMAVDPLNYQK